MSFTRDIAAKRNTLNAMPLVVVYIYIYILMIVKPPPKYADVHTETLKAFPH